MTREELLDRLRQAPLVASVQASPGPLQDVPTLLRLAQASIQEGVQVLRLEGVAAISAIRSASQTPCVGLIKRDYPDSEVRITPGAPEVDALIATGCEVIALDGTPRRRPGDAGLGSLINRIHDAGRLAMADCDTLESAAYAEAQGADFIGTTLSGYTQESPAQGEPDLELVRQLWRQRGVPVLAEGRYREPWQVQAALRAGACAVVVGGAINDAVKQTRALMPIPVPEGLVGAVDIGGTWLRFGVFDREWNLLTSSRVANPPMRAERLRWIEEQAQSHRCARLGVGSGGVIDPRNGICWTAKEYLMPDQIGIEFSERTLGLPTYAHGDGHATAWGHACLPQFAGRRVATLALGTGVGFGLVERGRIWSGPRGEYPRINDLPWREGTLEEVLGGLHLGIAPSDGQKELAREALAECVRVIRTLFFPDDIVIAGTVGLADWLSQAREELALFPTPFGGEAGLFGAAALALYPPRG